MSAVDINLASLLNMLDVREISDLLNKNNAINYALTSLPNAMQPNGPRRVLGNSAMIQPTGQTCPASPASNGVLPQSVHFNSPLHISQPDAMRSTGGSGGNVTTRDVDFKMLTLASIGTGRKLDRSVSEPISDERLGSFEQIMLGEAGSAGGAGRTASGRYKTELCRPFEENGHCKYGDKCQFAHSRNELRNLSRHPKYKTEFCRTYHTTGLCPYGPRCHFIHNEEERRMYQLNQLLEQQQAQLQQQASAVVAQQLFSQLSAPQPPSHLQNVPPHYALQRALSLSAAQDRPVMQQRMDTVQSQQYQQQIYYQQHWQQMRESLRSVADSPPPSNTESPSCSPTSSMFGSDDMSVLGSSGSYRGLLSPSLSNRHFDVIPENACVSAFHGSSGSSSSSSSGIRSKTPTPPMSPVLESMPFPTTTINPAVALLAHFQANQKLSPNDINVLLCQLLQNNSTSPVIRDPTTDEPFACHNSTPTTTYTCDDNAPPGYCGVGSNPSRMCHDAVSHLPPVSSTRLDLHASSRTVSRPSSVSCRLN